MADMDTYETDGRNYDDERDYPRERSRSPAPDRDGDIRIRDEPANGRSDRDGQSGHQNGNEEENTNTGSNLFVTGIHPRLSEEEVTALFEKYGPVEKTNIMRDPHTRESRGFGFVKMVDTAGADAAKDALQGEQYEGRTLSIEKARRGRPRTPTPGKYFGPPKRGPPTRPAFRDDYYDRPRGPPRDRYEDRGYPRRDGRDGRDDRRGGGGYRERTDERRYDDRAGGHGSRSGGADYPRTDRYESGGSRDDRYGDRRGGGGYGYDRAPRGPPVDRAGYPADGAGSGAPPSRDYEDRRRYD